MSYVDKALADLIARLPELEWKINGLTQASFSPKAIPRGLFRSEKELNAQVCINEIKSDIDLLNTRKTQYSSLYLAEKIQQKINVLVALCQMDKRRKKSNTPAAFSLKTISTRQQWIEGLEQEVKSLAAQREALIKTQDQLERNAKVEAVLSLKSELGEIERRLTTAQESLKKACS